MLIALAGLFISLVEDNLQTLQSNDTRFGKYSELAKLNLCQVQVLPDFLLC